MLRGLKMVRIYLPSVTQFVALCAATERLMYASSTTDAVHSPRSICATISDAVEAH